MRDPPGWSMVSSCALTRTPDGPRKARPSSCHPGMGKGRSTRRPGRAGGRPPPGRVRRASTRLRRRGPHPHLRRASRRRPRPRATTGMSEVNVAGPSSRPERSLGDGHERQLGGSELAAVERCRNRAGRVGDSNARERRPELAAGELGGDRHDPHGRRPELAAAELGRNVDCRPARAGRAIAATASARRSLSRFERGMCWWCFTVSSLWCSLP